MDYKDYYAILGVSKEASQDEIQRAYRKLARQYHPDINKEAGAEDRFKDVGEAYEVLKDPDKRAKYDRYGSAWKAAQEHGGTPPPGYEDLWRDFDGGAGAGFDLGSLFEQLFGSARQRAGQRRGAGPYGGQWEWSSPGEDQEAQITLPLDIAAHGGKRTMTLTDPATGRQKTLTVNIPKGIRAGQRIRLAGQGGQGMGNAPSGDLYLQVALEPHPTFRLEGSDLHTTVAITPWQAALGAEVALRTLDGEVKVKVPPGSSSGRKIRLRGKGYPTPHGGHGNLYAEIRIMVPSHLSARERALFEELEKISDFQPQMQSV